MNYYDPFLGFAAILRPPGETLAGLDNQAVLALNAGLEATYTDVRVPFADVAAAFDIESYPSVQSVENTCNWTWFCTPPPFGPDIHPNANGYGVIAAAFEELLPPSISQTRTWGRPSPAMMQIAPKVTKDRLHT
jgi:hypothetical protein